MSPPQNTYLEKERRIPIHADVDVIVVGAGLAGCSAAIASGRLGARTLLVERSGMVGGVSTAGLMASVTNFFFTRNNRQVIKGIPEEIIEKLVKEGVTSPHWRDSSVPQIPNDAEAMQSVLFNMLKGAGVRILLHTMVADAIVEKSDDGASRILKGLIIENKAGRQVLSGRIVVDCSGDADVAHFAGVPMKYPGGETCTLMFEMGGVDLQKTYEYYKKHPEDFDEEADIALPFSEFEKNWLERGIFHLPHGGGRRNTLLQNAIKEGRYSREKGMASGLDVLGLFATKGSNRVLVNSNYYSMDTLRDVEKLSQAELEARERCRELGKLLTGIMPGFENAFITRTASEMGVRLSRYIDGEYMITEDDLLSIKKFDDAIINVAAIERSARGVRVTNKTFGIPYRALLPKAVDSLLIGSGKSISAEPSPRAMCLRGQANTMAIGQAAGSAAAITVKNGKTVKALLPDDIKEIFAETSSA